ncbi:MAG: penicillin-binding protein 2, partial [Candidatus Portnoybacteria bacterium]
MSLTKYFIKNKARESIEAEEIFLDAEAVRSIEEKGKLEQLIKGRNFILFYSLIVFFLFALFVRAGYLQVARGKYYWDLSQGNKLRIYSTIAPRGIIYDRSGNPLVYNSPNFDLVVSLVDFFDNPEEIQEEILEKIAQTLESDKGDLKEKLEQARQKTSQLVLVSGLERSSSLVLESLAGDWPGVRVEKNAKRQYLYDSYFSHVLGYTGEASREDLASRLDCSLGDLVGKSGLEYQYQDILKGEPGQEQFEVDSLGKTQKLLATKSPQPGQGLILSLDKDLQQKAHQALESAPGRKGVLLAVDPRNGEVLAMVSLPSFDNNLFAEGISKEEMKVLETDPAEPFLNRALAGQYPSGSIIKPLIGAMALEEGIVSSSQQVNCQGGINIVNKYNPEIIYRFPDWKTHGLTNMVKAIAESCNVYFYTIGGGYGKIEGLGVDRIKKYLEYFGLGQPTNIDLPNEGGGLIPDEEWKESLGREEWYLGDTYHLSIGQGDILVTPIQMTMAIAAIANGGILYQPQLVDKIIDLNKKVIKDIPLKIVRSDFIKPENIAVAQKGMRQAVIDGSAQSLLNLPIEAAGKTGTAQFGNQGKTHSWFTGFAPYQNPEIVITVLVEGGGEGYLAAVPVAKEVLEWYF